ncbi:hypothetical protein [Paenibacillus sp. UASWS1643]|uniref:hypothetical protein n=1 Tax=Paenibacillus sp. UASWS1643 TaxID=2580422 RepID=UPI00123BD40C|nr:hypothetical protein [Paenibacillus sp. UASWS1643]KAA8756032.1 hypothetical protein FE296_05595 [Paenibacillus sp. UASWS1643]
MTNTYRINRPRGKILAAVLTAVFISLAMGIHHYVPIDERLENTYYYSFGYTFAVGLLINLAILIFLITPLSILVDGLILYRKKDNTHMRLLVTIAAYALSGCIGGIIYSIFTRNFNTFSPQTIHIVVCSLVFLTFQLVLNRSFLHSSSHR